jgi:hypothetical protein
MSDGIRDADYDDPGPMPESKVTGRMRAYLIGEDGKCEPGRRISALESEVARLTTGLEWTTSEKHSAQADAEREKNRADTLALEVARLTGELTEAQSKTTRLDAAIVRVRERIASAVMGTGGLKWDWRDEIAAIDAARTGGPVLSPCGHSSQYTYSEDSGKNIRCLLCSEARLKRELADLHALRPLLEQLRDACAEVLAKRAGGPDVQ